MKEWYQVRSGTNYTQGYMPHTTTVFVIHCCYESNSGIVYYSNKFLNIYLFVFVCLKQDGQIYITFSGPFFYIYRKYIAGWIYI